MIKKNIFFSLLSLFIFLVLLYLISFFYFKKFIGFKNLELIKYKDQIVFYEKYVKRLHHLRHYLSDSVDKDKLETILFTASELNKIDNTSEVLFLGDSWFEQIVSYKSSNQLIKDYFSKNTSPG